VLTRAPALSPGKESGESNAWNFHSCPPKASPLSSHMMNWKKGQLVWIESDQALGPAIILDDAEVFQLKFLQNAEERGYTKKNPPFKKVQLFEGQKVKVRGEAAELLIQGVETINGICRFTTPSGSFSESDIVSLSSSSNVRDLLRQKKFTKARAFGLRKEAWDYLHLRDSHPLKGAVGCRVQCLPHQLWVLDSILKMTTARALLADEVGLGKTIEAGLAFSALHARESLKKVLILVPAALKVQWLMETYRRFNVRFRLDHEELIEESDFRDFVVTSLDELDKNVESLDLLIVDEAHRLVHDSQKSEQLAELVRKSKHVLFLSATPRVHGPEEFSKMMKILATSGETSLPTAIFQSRRKELGLPTYRHLEPAMVDNKEEWLFKFLEQKLAENEKVFVIASAAQDILDLSAKLRSKLGEKFALFHEQMTLVERDRQAAYFADPEGAQILLSSEIGGEGRNFQFCHHMVLYDLPADPLVVEQRIGRLDRLGQTKKVFVWCPIEEKDAENFEKLRDEYRVFEEPWSGPGFEDDAKLKKGAGENVGLSYDGKSAQALVASVQNLAQTNIRDFLEHLYDLFGVEVEDFDTHGNWRVFSSSLMFVDYFPGLGESGERVLTFDRSQALAREDMTFFSVDHPDFIEALEFLLNSDQGKLTATQTAAEDRSDLRLLALLKEKNVPRVQLQAWSCSEKRATKAPTQLEFRDSPTTLKLLETVLPKIVDQLDSFVRKFEDKEIDSLMIEILK
jgi:ATP-dependent helicase HepA